MTPLTRRSFLASLPALAAAIGAASQEKAKPILLRSSWQTVNIGDIAHTPGMLRLLETLLPGVPVILWPVQIGDGVEERLRRAFPQVRIVKGKADAAEVREAFDEAGLMLHGSGPSVVARDALEAWRKHSKKPYGIGGVTLGEINAGLLDLLSNAAFVYCRDSDSLAALKASGATCPIQGLMPDATFGLHLRDDAAADAWLKAKGLEEKKFLCVVPRLRWTPYHQMHKRPETDETRRKDRVNEEFREVDHAKLRAAVVAWVRETGLPVLACPEMTYQVELLAPLLIDPLPDDVKPKVLRRETYWLTDEAASTYARARAVLSLEMHSPIIAAANGTPAIHVRQPTDTRKGKMWEDVGLGRWLFDVDRASGEDLAKAVVGIHRDNDAAKAALATAMDFVRARYREDFAVIGKALPG